MSAPSGRLVMVGTPIGNLEDISARAVRVLGELSVVYCEDTRRTRSLYSALGLKAPRLVRLDRHNETEMAEQVVACLALGSDVGLLSDAGMPTISDPGAALVRRVSDAGFTVSVIPGPCSLSAALAVSGLPGDGHRFAGFLARKGTDRTLALAAIAASPVTTVVFEAANRVGRTTEDLASACGPDRPFVWVRELTKIHEEVWRGTLGGAVRLFSREPQAGELRQAEVELRGEWILMVGPADTEADDSATPEQLAELLRRALADGTTRRDAVEEVVEATGAPRKAVYRIALDLDRPAAPKRA